MTRPHAEHQDCAEYTEIHSAAEVRDLLGEPSRAALTRERPHLHEMDRAWLAASPFCVVATSNAHGACAVSPKGDPAGHLVHVLDDKTIVLPERRGNRRADGMLNILDNPHVAVLFLIPGRTAVLGINGRARVLRDAPFFDALAVRGSRPTLALLVEVEQVYFNCPKALMRSELWQPQTWQPDALPSHAQLIKAVQDTPETLPELEAHYAVANYAEHLY